MILAALPVWAIVLISVVGVVLVALIVMIIIGSKMQKKQEATQADIDAAAQIMSMLIIDKKRMKLKDANLPKQVIDQTPKYLRGAKMPFVKVKAGPRVLTLIADAKIYDQIPLKTEIKAKVSGLYITEIISSRTKLEPQPKKKGFRAKLMEKASEAQKRNQEDTGKKPKKVKGASPKYKTVYKK